MFHPYKWLFDLFRFGGFALVIGGLALVASTLTSDGFALVIVGVVCLIASQRMKERRGDLDR